MIPKGFLWGFYIDLFRSNKSHLPFKDPGSIRMPIGPLHMDLYWEDRCKDSKGIDKSFKDFFLEFYRVAIRTQRGV